MQFKSILAVLSLTLAATAIPLEGGATVTLVERTGTTNTQKCSNTQVASFCHRNDNSGLGASSGDVISIVLNVLPNVLPNLLSGLLQCTTILGNNQANACCNANQVTQTGTINVNAANCIAAL